MAYNEQLAERIERIVLDAEIPFETKKMFGGLCFMINDKMSIGIVKEDVMLRVMDYQFEKVLQLPHTRPMDFTGKRMHGFLYISPEGFIKDQDLKTWVDKGIEFGLKGELKTKKKK